MSINNSTAISNSVFFSVFRSNLGPTTNNQRHGRIRSSLLSLGIDFKDVSGKYSGVTESSLVMPLKLLPLAIDIASKHSQESILTVDSDNNASLIFIKDNSVSPLGKLVETSKVNAMLQDAYSIIKGKYYIVN